MKDIQAIPLADARYPALLAQTAHPPKWLYVKGSSSVLAQPAIAIVGTRKASPQALQLAGHIAHDLAKAGLVIISGLAQGIDGAAHQGALEARGKTIAVLGSSLEERLLFPSQHKRLAQDILASGGALISEHEKDQPALKHHFVLRNRIIAGLALGVLVAQAPLKSGALITADYAKKAQRLVFGVPDSPFVTNAKGSNDLIAKGALLVQSGEDILGVLLKQNLFVPQRTNEPDATLAGADSEEELMLVQVLRDGLCDIDKLSQRTKVEIPKLLSLLATLEIKGVVKSIGGAYILSE